MAHPHRASGLLWPAMRNSNANIIKKLLNPPCRTIIFMFWPEFGHASFPHSTRRTPLKPAKQFYKHRAERPPRQNTLAGRPVPGCKTGCLPRRGAAVSTPKPPAPPPPEAPPRCRGARTPTENFKKSPPPATGAKKAPRRQAGRRRGLPPALLDGAQLCLEHLHAPHGKARPARLLDGARI